MTTLGMLILTLLTVLGSLVMGWLLRRYMLGGRCEQFGTDTLLENNKGKLGLLGAGGAAATAAALSGHKSGAAPSSDGEAMSLSDAPPSERVVAFDVSDQNDARSGKGGSATSGDGTTKSKNAKSKKKAEASALKSDDAETKSSKAKPKDTKSKKKTKASAEAAALKSDDAETKSGKAKPKDTKSKKKTKASAEAAALKSDDTATKSGKAKSKDTKSKKKAKKASGDAAALTSGDAEAKSGKTKSKDTKSKKKAKKVSEDAAALKSGDAETKSGKSKSKKSLKESKKAKKAGDSASSKDNGSIKSAQVGKVASAAAPASDKGNTSKTLVSADNPAKLEDLEATQAEIRRLRARLGMSEHVEKAPEGTSLDQQLEASHKEASELRQQVFSRSTNNSGTNGKAGASGGDTSGYAGSEAAARRSALADAAGELDALKNGGDADAQDSGAQSEDEREAMRLLESGDFVADDSNRPAGLLDRPSDGPKDDLQTIRGVGPKLENMLNENGVFYFRQIAGFTSRDIAWIDTKLSFRGRVVRDNWVGQAKRLS